MEKFVIYGNKPLKGEILVQGAKNAATPILAASLLTNQPCVIDNLPLIGDVLKMLEILESMGAEISWLDQRKIRIQAKDIDPVKIKTEIVSKLRSSILFLGPLLTRFKKIKMPHPGGCLIGARPVDTHLKAFSDLGVEINQSKEYFYLKRSFLKGSKIILKEFSVTGTENALMSAVKADGKTEITMAALEPYILDLIKFLKKMGAQIKGQGTHTLQIKGVKKLKGAVHTLMYDPIEAGTFLILGAATKSKILVKNVEVNFLEAVIEKLKDFGVNLQINNNNSVRVLGPAHLKASKVMTMIYPGIYTDLQAPFGVLATQAQGASLIHDTLYEGRLKYLEELKKMGADAIICDPHRAIIFGPTPLYGSKITSFDLRAGATLIIAALLAKGRSEITEAYQVDRGYEKIEQRLQQLGADIKREN